MSFGESLTEIRKSKGISRKDLAEQLDIPYTTLRNYETDQREPGHKLLIKIATLLSVSVDELVGYRVKKESASPYSSEALRLAGDYDWLDEHGKRIVRLVADEEKARCTEQAAPHAIEIRAIALGGGVHKTEADSEITLPDGGVHGLSEKCTAETDGTPPAPTET